MSERLPSPGPEALVTTGEAARLCAVDPRTMARWVDAGVVPSHRTVGGRRRMRRADLLAFMRERGMPLLAEEPPRPLRIAVVDDDPDVVRALGRALRRIAPGADCRSAHDGFSAGALLTSFRPDLVFLDIFMPGLSGVEVCERIRATPDLADIRVVVVSGHLSDGLRAQLAQLRVDRVLAKPFTTDDIRAAAGELLRSSVQVNGVRHLTKEGV